jgi:hypothetical protein
MGNAGRNGGEYYTPRPLIRAIVRVVAPKIGETVYDGAVRLRGLPVRGVRLPQGRPNLTTKDVKTLQERTFYGKEKKSLAYVIAIMNMILHGIEAPNIIHTNTLTENLADVQEKDRYDVILANPPFGGKERKEVQQNFPIRTGETAFLFLQHFIKMLRRGRAGVVIKTPSCPTPTTPRSASANSCSKAATCTRFSIAPAARSKGRASRPSCCSSRRAPTRKTWYYQLDPGRNMGKTNPLNDDDLAEFIKLQKTKADSPKSWSVDVKAIDPEATLRPLRQKPDGGEEVVHRSPQKILGGDCSRRRRVRGGPERTIRRQTEGSPGSPPPLPEQRRIVGLLDEAFAAIAAAKATAEQNLQNARALFESHLNAVFTQRGKGWVETTVDQISTNLDSQRIPITKSVRSSGKYPYYGASGIVDYVADYIFDCEALLVSEDGANLLMRSTPIAFSVNGRYWVNNHAHILKFKHRATQRFVEFYLESITLDEYVTGAAQPKLTQKALNSIPIPIPKAVEAQAEIVKSIEDLSAETTRLAAHYARKLAALEELKKSLLHQAFAGEL